MVSQRPRVSATSRERLLQAASVEFAARGFNGARVDRIAELAGVNKAMLYYHFEDKAALYREALRELFESVAERVREALTIDGTPEDRLHRYIRIVADETAARPHYPRMWLRELAEGGEHLDESIVKAIAAILGSLASILHEGQVEGRFRAVHPMVVQMSLVAPLLLFAASAPMRERFSTLVPGKGLVPREAMVEYLERAATSALRVEPNDTPASTKSRRRRS
jgi:AcrR family transcriptional regulator